MKQGQWTVLVLLLVLLGLEVLRSQNVRDFFTSLLPANIIANIGNKDTGTTTTKSTTTTSVQSAQKTSAMKKLTSNPNNQ
jgi:hypothetical protein